jgi:hypothetical protein
MAERAAAATAVPVLLVETPASPVGAGDRAAVAGRYPAGATVVEVPAALDAVAAAVVDWAGAR